jgi:hypothetical protein
MANNKPIEPSENVAQHVDLTARLADLSPRSKMPATPSNSAFFHRRIIVGRNS